MTKIAVLDDYLELAQQLAPWDSLPGGPEVTFYHDRGPSIETLMIRLRDAEIVCTVRERTAIPRALLERLPALRMIAGTGRTQANVDVDFATERGILIATTGGASNSTVDLTWGLIIAILRQIPQQDAALRAGTWQTSAGISLEGKTLGIFGLGNIGSRMAKIAQDFGMKVIAWGPTLTEERAARNGAEMLTKEEVLRCADILTIHWRLSELTRGQVGAAELALMKPTAYLINTARGPIVDEAALVDALRNYRIAGAAMDVYDNEPLRPDHPYLSLKNTVLTPHLGYASIESLRAYYQQTVDNIRDYLQDGHPKPSNLLNPEALKRRPSR